jgi:CRISPR/Cas system CSM-associated protein Csm2 small subunit
MVGDKVGFRAATAVDIAAFAKKHNLTPEQANALFDKINNGVEIISGGNKAIQRDLDEATRRYVTGPDTPEARKALEDSYRKHADTPEKREAAEATTKALQAAAQQTQADVAARNAKVAKAAEADTKNDDVIAGLNEPQPQKADAPKVDAKDVPAKAPAPQAQRAPAPK